MTKTTLSSSVDVLSDAIDSLEAGGALFFRGSLATPWNVTIPGAPRILEVLGQPPGIDTVLLFHAVLRGAPQLHYDGAEGPLQLDAGDLVLLRLDEPHRLGEGEGGACLTMESIVQGHDLSEPLVFDAGAGPGSVKLICGGFFLRNTALHPLVNALPAVTRVRARGGFDVVSFLLSRLARESEEGTMGSRAVVRRIADLLLVETLRAAMQQEAHGGWLTALRDPIMSRALGAIHAHPGAPWTVPGLARHIGVSASGLTVRFREVLEVSPGRYLTTWRMHLATRLLAGGDLSLTEIAEAVGYGSTAAFSRTFKRVVGEAPGRWRAEAEVS